MPGHMTEVRGHVTSVLGGAGSVVAGDEPKELTSALRGDTRTPAREAGGGAKTGEGSGQQYYSVMW